MKIQSTGHAIESNGIQATSSFSIKTSAHAFQMLSSGLYTNKIQAVVRELACNAADAHVMVGRTAVPFEIKVPNRLDGQFYVKDFGPGLNEEQVMRLYTTYFESTKSASNAFTGGFGLGSKSPFAYTDSFTVESRQQGVKTIYTAFVGEDSVPQIAKLNSMDTEEADGLTVGFPVKPDDSNAFAEEVTNVLHWFAAPAVVRGMQNEQVVRFDDPAVRSFAYRSAMYAIEGECWSPVKHAIGRIQGGNSLLRRKKPLPSDQLGTVIMGNVHYPLTFQSEWRGNAVVEWWNTVKPFLFIPIGMFSVAVSREALAYDKSTQRAVLKFLNDAFMEFAKETAKELERAVDKFTGLEQHQKARQYLMSLGMNTASVIDAYLDAIEASDTLRAVVAVRDILPFTPQAFDLVVLDNYQHRLGTPHSWVPQQKGTLKVDPLHDYYVVENATSAFGVEADKAYGKLWARHDVMSGYGRTHRLMLVPKRGQGGSQQYHDEVAAWKKATGMPVIVFTGADIVKDSSVKVPARRFNGSWRWDDVILTESQSEFFWATESQWAKFGKESAHEIHGFVRNLGLPDLETRLFVIHDGDAKLVMDKLPNQKPFFDTFVALLNQPKMVKKIEKIKPMLSGSSAAFTRLRSRLKNEPLWQAGITGTNIGQWVEKMKNTKGPQSYDFSTTRVLASFKKVAGAALQAPVPEFYDGRNIEMTITKEYPLLRVHLEDKAVVPDAMIAHMQAYISWCEANGAKPPMQQMDFDTVP